MPTSIPTSRISAAAAPTSRYARRSTPLPRTRDEEAAMNNVAQIDRRSFVVSAASLGGGLALGLDIPFGGPQVIRAQDGSPEINAWVIRPDDTVVIRIARSEMGQGTLTDAAAVEKMPGVKKVVQVGDSGVAVVADTWWHAKTALDALPITWDEGENAKVSSASIAEWLKAGLEADEAFVGNANGDVKAALAGAAKKVEAVYAYPYQNHACMEPMNATALYTADKCEVWGPTQNGEAAFAAAVQASGLSADKVETYKIHLGGGFGRRVAYHDFTTQAVLIAKQMPGTPIKLLWSREEDMAQGRYHPVMQCKLVGGFDANNNLTALHMRLSGQSILADVAPERLVNGKDPVTFQGLMPSGTEFAFGYSIPNLMIDHAMRNPHIKPGFWRGVNINQNAIFLECFMDELAQAVGQDELEFRRKLMGDHPRNLAVLNAVAERIGWGKPAPQGIYRGLAHLMAFNSFVAAAAEVSVTGNKMKVHRIVGATDPTYAVNPAQIDRQVSGSFVYGLSALFYQECTVKN